GARTRDVQLGKTTVNWKQRTLRFLHLVLAIENIQFSLCALFTDQTEHKRSTRSRVGRAPALAPPTTIRNAAQSMPINTFVNSNSNYHLEKLKLRESLTAEIVADVEYEINDLLAWAPESLGDGAVHELFVEASARIGAV